MRIRDLTPGDKISPAGDPFDKIGCPTFIGFIKPHPLYPNFWMVIWRLGDGSVSFDALAPGQEIQGELVERGRVSLRKAILGHGE